MNNNNLYIDIDSLIDTRLPLLYSIDKELVQNIVKDKSYFHRTSDDFSYLDSKVFNKIYSYRNKMVLKTPLVTDMVGILLDYTLKAKMTLLESNMGDNVDVYLNIYPYDLNFKEIEHIKNNIGKMLPSFTTIYIINKSIEELTIDFIIKHIKMMVKYDGMKWLQYHMDVGDLNKKSLPDVTLLVPKLIENKKIIKSNQTNNFFKDIKEKSKVYIDLEFLHIKYFCVLKK